MLQGSPKPEKLRFAFSWWGKDGEELEELEELLKDRPATRLVIIDTLVRFGNWRLGNYQIDYRELAKFKDIADRYHIALILVLHERKCGAKDWLDRASGSPGLTGVPDTIIRLDRQRSQDEATLFISGRDLADTEIPVRFDRHTCSWSSENRRRLIT